MTASLTRLASDPLLQGGMWSAATIAAYFAAKWLHRHRRSGWLTPLATAPAILLVAALLLHTSYADYIRGTHWLVTLLGPATVAFAVPIYQQRALVRRYWLVLAAGIAAGSATAMLSAWVFATTLGLNGTLRLSLLPRSMSTPFAMATSHDIGGDPELTALFVILTGVLGATFGQVLLARLPIRSALARGALLGMSAHGAGTAKARELGREEGTIAGLVMVLVGIVNVLVAPVLAWCLK
ncbi:MAG TPA: LrgB family protein [Alphaproteobacteria bacterium]|nr:LrgB family protein [Alphaproteobacteria bacterium]